MRKNVSKTELETDKGRERQIKEIVSSTSGKCGREVIKELVLLRSAIINRAYNFQQHYDMMFQLFLAQDESTNSIHKTRMNKYCLKIT